VESAAAALGVPECVAVGVPDPLLGEAIVLVVGQTPAAAPDVETLLHGLRGALASWQVPRSIDHLGTPLPRNANGKFDRMLIRSEALRRHRHD
jgi:acyl-CoA synthetase (AMP-forming)/AMP-acid ligase II